MDQDGEGTMDEVKRILIGDADPVKRRELVELFQAAGDFHLVGQTASGLELVRLARELQPDGIILDLVLTEADGIDALEKLQTLPHRPRTMVISSCTSDIMADIALASGADYYMIRPCDDTLLCRRARQLIDYGRQRKDDTRWRIMQASGILRELGLPVHVLGYQYAREAILMAVQDRTVLAGMTKVVYPDVAKRCGSTPSRVERSIRHAVDIIWTRGNPGAIRRYFGNRLGEEKPSNSEFVAGIAEYISLEQLPRQQQTQQ